MWGLPISGDPITGITDSVSIHGRLSELLGVKDDEIKGLMKKKRKDANERTSDILLAKKGLRERFKTLPTDASEQQLRWLVFFLFKILFVFCIFNNVLTF